MDANTVALKARAVQLEAALRLARDFIRREQIEHAVVDMSRPNLGLGEYLDQVLDGTDAAHGEAKERK